MENFFANRTVCGSIACAAVINPGFRFAKGETDQIEQAPGCCGRS
jgi:hypothetical protein